MNGLTEQDSARLDVRVLNVVFNVFTVWWWLPLGFIAQTASGFLDVIQEYAWGIYQGAKLFVLKAYLKCRPTKAP